MLKGLTEGRIVSYVLAVEDLPYGGQHNAGKVRAAIVTEAWRELNREDGYSNLTVFTDWSNDGVGSGPCIWATSRSYSEGLEPGTWHWPTDSERLRTEKAERNGYPASEPSTVVESLKSIDNILAESLYNDGKASPDAAREVAMEHEAVEQPELAAE